MTILNNIFGYTTFSILKPPIMYRAYLLANTWWKMSKMRGNLSKGFLVPGPRLTTSSWRTKKEVKDIQKPAINKYLTPKHFEDVVEVRSKTVIRTI